MKTNLLKITAIALIFIGVGITSCDKEPNLDLGEVYFKTDKVWVVGNQTWSDVVMANACKKNTFFGGDWKRDKYCADCCQNPGYGDMFSWRAVNYYKDQLCPAPWRVPTRQDFIDLDIALGGTGERRRGLVYDTYLNPDVWGGAFGGRITSDGELVMEGKDAFYWSHEERRKGRVGGFYLHFNYNRMGFNIEPQGVINKDNGFMLRCVQCNYD